MLAGGTPVYVGVGGSKRGLVEGETTNTSKLRKAYSTGKGAVSFLISFTKGQRGSHKYSSRKMIISIQPSQIEIVYIQNLRYEGNQVMGGALA